MIHYIMHIFQDISKDISIENYKENYGTLDSIHITHLPRVKHDTFFVIF